MLYIKNYYKLVSMLLCVGFSDILCSKEEQYDVTVVGCARFSNGIGRNAIAAMDYLQDTLKINFKDTRPGYTSFKDIPVHVKKVIKQAKTDAPTTVAILYEALKLPGQIHYTKMPNATIKLAYSMVESTKIPVEWTSILNTHFDAVVVPDEWLVEIYQKCGVKKPIFVVPHPVYMDQFLKNQRKQVPNGRFTFGTNAALSNNKNCELLVEAFIKEFGNEPNVHLHIHTLSQRNDPAALRILKKLKQSGIKTVTISHKELSWKHYAEHMKSLDCYVLISKGEGFSITPREAMAAGIPCIVSNNTAHKTLCKSGFVYPVPAEIMQENLENGYGEPMGYNFTCRLEDVSKALRNIYSDYSYYLNRAQQGREWVKQYDGKILKKRYLNLFKPKSIIFGAENKITDDFMMTNDRNLYNKYTYFLSGHIEQQKPRDKQATKTEKNVVDLKKYDVDFNESLGAHDAYQKKHYQHMLTALKNPAGYATSFKWLSGHSPQELLTLAQKTYAKYKPSHITPSSNPRIPRIFHHIWIGKKPFPEKYKEWQKGWKSIPGWTYKLWTDHEVAHLDMVNKDLYHKEPNLGSRADILRIEILNKFGGVYIDTDFECYEPKMFDFLSNAYDFFCGFHPLDSLYHHQVFAYNNAIIGSIPGHPILKAWLSKRKFVNPSATVIEKGPAYFTRSVLENADKGYRDIIFPPTFFYPVGNMQMNVEPYSTIKNLIKRMKSVKKDSIRPETIAIHWWDGSWTLPHAWFLE